MRAWRRFEQTTTALPSTSADAIQALNDCGLVSSERMSVSLTLAIPSNQLPAVLANVDDVDLTSVTFTVRDYVQGTAISGTRRLDGDERELGDILQAVSDRLASQLKEDRLSPDMTADDLAALDRSISSITADGVNIEGLTFAAESEDLLRVLGDTTDLAIFRVDLGSDPQPLLVPDAATDRGWRQHCKGNPELMEADSLNYRGTAEELGGS